MLEAPRRLLTRVGELMATPAAFGVWFVYVCSWLIFDPGTFDWHAIATIITWAMTLLIQRAGHRDTQAIQAKLDELLRADNTARTELTTIDQKQPEDIETHRAAMEQAFQTKGGVSERPNDQS